MSDKTLLDLFVLLGFSDESHLLWLTAREVHIKERPGTDKCLFLYNEREAGPHVKMPEPNRYEGKCGTFTRRCGSILSQGLETET